MFQPSVKDLQNPEQNPQNSHRHNPSFDALTAAANSAQTVVFQSNLGQAPSLEQMMCITSPTFQGLEQQPAGNSRREAQQLANLKMTYEDGYPLGEQVNHEQENSAVVANNQSFQQHALLSATSASGYGST